MSYNKTGRELMTPDELRVMDNTNCVLFIRGLYPFFTTKYPLENHPNYSKCGDGNKKLMYDVKQKVHTGQKRHQFNMQEDISTRLYRDAQMSDTREGDFQRRMNNRPVERRSAHGRELHRQKPLTEEFPGLLTSPEELTPEQTQALQESTHDLEFEGISGFTTEQMEEYQNHIQSMFDMVEPDPGFEYIDFPQN